MSKKEHDKKAERNRDFSNGLARARVRWHKISQRYIVWFQNRGGKLMYMGGFKGASEAERTAGLLMKITEEAISLFIGEDQMNEGAKKVENK